MVIECPSCKTRFAIDAEQLAGVENPRFHCSRCDHFFELGSTEEEKSAPEPDSSQEPTEPVEEEYLSADDLDGFTSEIEEESAEPEQLQLLPNDDEQEYKNITQKLSRQEIESIVDSTGGKSPLVTAEWPDQNSDKPFEADLGALRQSLLGSVEGEELGNQLKPKVGVAKIKQSELEPSESEEDAMGWRIGDFYREEEEEIPAEDIPDAAQISAREEIAEDPDSLQFRFESRSTKLPIFDDEDDEVQKEEYEPALGSWQEVPEEPDPEPLPSHEVEFSSKQTVRTSIDKLIGAKSQEPESGEFDYLGSVGEEPADFSSSGSNLPTRAAGDRTELDLAKADGSLRYSDSAFKRLRRKVTGQRVIPETGSETEAGAVAQNETGDSRKMASFGSMPTGQRALIVFISVPVLFLLLFWFWGASFAATPVAVKEMLHADPGNLPKVAPPGLALIDVRSDILTLDDGNRVLQISGEIVNATLKGYKAIRIEAELFNKDNHSLNKRVVAYNNALQNARLQALNESAIENLQAKESMDVDQLEPNKKVPFRIVFTEVSGTEAWFSTRIYSVGP